MLTKDEQALYNALTLYADEDGEISEDISFNSLGELAGVGTKSHGDSARRLLYKLRDKGVVKFVIATGTKFKEIRLLN